MRDSAVLCRLEEIPDGDAIAVPGDGADGADVVLLRIGHQVFAYHNECPHAGRSLEFAPGKFLVRDGRVICAAHGATFAVDSGACLGGPCRSGLVAIGVEVVDGTVRRIAAA